MQIFCISAAVTRCACEIFKRKTLVKVTTRVRGNAFLLSYLLAIKSTFFSSFSPCSSGPFILKNSAFSHSDQESSRKETKPLINCYVNKSHSLAEIINQDWEQDWTDIS